VDDLGGVLLRVLGGVCLAVGCVFLGVVRLAAGIVRPAVAAETPRRAGAGATS
jgi:hypothetical protein